MKKQNFLLTIFLILFSVLVLLEVMFNQGNASTDKLDPAKSGMQSGQSETRGLEGPISQKSSESEIKSRISQTIGLGKLPLYFIANRGQVDSQGRYYARASRYTLWLTPEGLVFDSLRAEGQAKEPVPGHQPPLPEQLSPGLHHRSPMTRRPAADTKFHRDVSRLFFLGANPKPVMQAIDEQELKVNYFKGNDPAKWQGNVPTFKAVLYQDLYPHIDLKVYGIEREVEYDWIIRPGGDPGQIRFAYKNVKSTRIDAEGNLVIETEFGEIRHQKPASYQVEVAFNSHVGAQRAVPGDKSYRKEPGLEKRIPIDAKFQQTGPDTYGFTIEKYDNTRPLIIDPVVLLYSTYLGGSGFEHAINLSVDAKDNVYLVGWTNSCNFPTKSAFQDDHTGGTINDSDAFITKIDTNQKDVSCLVYSTYLGGSDNDLAYDIFIDNNDNVYVEGDTSSTDFPTRNAFQGTYGGGSDAFVSRIDTTKSGLLSLVYSTYLGGNDYDRSLSVAADIRGNVFVSGNTGSIDFPTQNAFQGSYGGGVEDGFITRIDTTKSGVSSLLYSTFLGGRNGDSFSKMSIDKKNDVYVVGQTYSTDFPTRNAFQGIYGSGLCDIFVSRIDTTKSGDSSLIYSTFLGGSNDDYYFHMSLDTKGNVYVTGGTNSTDFPARNAFQDTYGGGWEDAFVTRIDTTQSGALSLVYSTYLGGDDYDWGFCITVDARGNVFVTGWTCSINFPTQNAFQDDLGGEISYDSDTFVTKINTTQSGVSSLLYSTYLGGYYNDYSDDIVIDRMSHVYVAGWTQSTNFPMRNAFQASYGGGWGDTFVAMIDTTRSGASSLLYSTYLGGSDDDIFSDMFIDNNGDLYITGSTYSFDFPIQNFYQTYQGNSDVFLTKLTLISPPSVKTKAIYSITPISAWCDAEVTGNGGGRIESRGVCWSTHAKLTISDSHTVESGSMGSFSSFISKLVPNTTYYARAYAKNTAGVGYGDAIQFKTLNKPIISGRVIGQGAGLADVILTSSDDLSQNRTDRQGSYSLIVDYGWTGIVTPQKTGYAFVPSCRAYEMVTYNLSSQNYTAYPFKLSLKASRETEQAWIIARQYARIEVKIENPVQMPVAVYQLLKKEGDQSFQVLQAIPVGQIQGDTYIYLDKYLDKTKTYTYKFIALDSNFFPIAVSNEVTI